MSSDFSDDPVPVAVGPRARPAGRRPRAPVLLGTEIQALSVGGLETCIQLPGWDLAFDIGRCPPGAVARSRVLVTHAHMDHAGGLAYHAATRDLYGMSPPTYWVPPQNLADFEELMAVWRRLDRSELACTLVGVGPGERFSLGGNRWAEPFRSPHRVVCQGYALGTTRAKLRPEHQGLSGPELQALRATGAALTERVDVVEVAFTGDTTIEVVERIEAVRTARLLVMEVTFVGDDVPPAKAHAKGHVHLDDVAARADLFQNEALLFTHFSARYSPAAIRRELDRRLPRHLRERVVSLPELQLRARE